MQMRPEGAEARPQITRVATREIANRANFELMHTRERHTADAPQAFDGEWFKKSAQVIRTNQQEAVGLRQVAQDFRCHFGRRDAD